VEETEIGPMATARQLETLDAQVNATLQAGARLLTGGRRILGPGFYFEPTVIADLPRTASVYRDEIFGPVALLFRAKDLDEAIEIANDTPFGLAASAWTRDPAEQQRLVAEIQAGAVFLNKMVASDPRLPFGGIKHSGYGRELSAAGMREFLNAKTVYVA
jgi:succinate-semialdehyde dehydrogenase/glutarate-semialdehyde dehydrogenase